MAADSCNHEFLQLALDCLYLIFELLCNFCFQAQVVPQLVGVPLQNWVHFILQGMVGALEEIRNHGIKVYTSNM